MQRYFLEIAYKGTAYNGFQIQKNANTIQAEVEKALQTLFKQSFELTGSSRTDAGVHALQNFFHFDSELQIEQKAIYNLNAILPADIVAKNIYKVTNDNHSRFDADARAYKYYIYQNKNAFVADRAYFFPFAINEDALNATAAIILQHTDFTSFSKKHTQVNNFICSVKHSFWSKENDCLVYNVKANRFLRGMVRGLVATQLKVARDVISTNDFENILLSKDCNNAYFEAPAHGLFLVEVDYPKDLLK
ncbi:MAG: tRNA pseudouridine(38-40) synthase TruA [Bacteroidetes bacterium]|nr:tRNA pseudouridine(38-40) synthase TruA [Bacteroidota bacterium]